MSTCICISRTHGCGASGISRSIADRLRLPLYNQEIFEAAVRISGVDTSLLEPTRPKEANRWLNEYAENPAFVGKSPQEILIAGAKQGILEMAGRSDCIFVGWEAAAVLREASGQNELEQNDPVPRGTAPAHTVLSVFLDAPPEVRIAHLMKKKGLTQLRARREIRKVDELRRDLFRLMDPAEKPGSARAADWEDLNLYDVCFCTAALEPADIAEAVCSLYFRLKGRESGGGA